MYRTHGYPYDTRLARRLADDRSARRARRRRKAVTPARARSRADRVPRSVG